MDIDNNCIDAGTEMCEQQKRWIHTVPKDDWLHDGLYRDPPSMYAVWAQLAFHDRSFRYGDPAVDQPAAAGSWGYSQWMHQLLPGPALDGTGRRMTKEQIAQNAFLRSEENPEGTAVRNAVQHHLSELHMWIELKFLCPSCSMITRWAKAPRPTWYGKGDDR